MMTKTLKWLAVMVLMFASLVLMHFTYEQTHTPTQWAAFTCIALINALNIGLALRCVFKSNSNHNHDQPLV